MSLQGDLMTYYVYILASVSRALYVGVTSSLNQRTWEHREGTKSRFASRYNINRLVHYEIYESVHIAISREKQIKGWSRAKKIKLIEESNAGWSDLGTDWQRGSEEPLSKRTVDPSLPSG